MVNYIELYKLCLHAKQIDYEWQKIESCTMFTFEGSFAEVGKLITPWHLASFLTPDMALGYPMFWINRCHVWHSFWRHVWRQKAPPCRRNPSTSSGALGSPGGTERKLFSQWLILHLSFCRSRCGNRLESTFLAWLLLFYLKLYNINALILSYFHLTLTFCKVFMIQKS